MRVLVIGGTGTLGRPLARQLQAEGATVRLLSRQPAPPGTQTEWAQGDIVTGEGLAAAMQEVDVVIHAAHDPRHPKRDLEGVRQVISAAQHAGIGHFVYVSIVGAADMPGLPYYRAKAEGERLVSGAPLSTTMFRASQFFEFVAATLGQLDRLPILPLPAGARLQPVSVDEVAAALAEHVLRGGPDRLVGPEVLTLRDLAQTWQAARGRIRRLVPFSLPHPALRALAQGALTSADAPRGALRWSEWLAGWTAGTTMPGPAVAPRGAGTR